MWGRSKRLERQVSVLLVELNRQSQRIQHMSVELTNLQAAVAANTTAVQAAVAKIGSLEDPAQLVPLTAAITASTTALNDAVNPPAPATPAA